jgi:hypothetical protein
LGFETAEAMLEVAHTQGAYASGARGTAQRARGNREITLIVNGRPVKDTALAQSLSKPTDPCSLATNSRWRRS